MGDFFYKPRDGWLADVIPFHEDGEFKLLYLKDWRDKEKYGEGTPWFLLGTKDFVGYTEYGEVLPRGGEDEQDLYIYTGCILKADGRYHIFYTGNNFHFPSQGKKQQAVMHAVSDDMLHWTKIPEDAFYAREDLYEVHDWRDPFVFWNEEAGEYWMLLAARLKEGPANRRGCVALCASKDLKSWETREPFWAPYLYTTHECPDLFRIGDWWYLVYSTFSDRTVTHYRMSRSLQGPWTAPADDAFDTRAFYAAKTWSDGQRRYAFGWNPTREGEHDYGTWQWGGELIVHEIDQRENGTLSVKVPKTVGAAFATEVPFEWSGVLGEWSLKDGNATASAADSFACATAGTLPDVCKITAKMSFGSNTRACGFVLKTDESLDRGYQIRFEPGRSRVVLDVWPRKGDIPFVVGMERPIELKPDVVCEVEVYVDGTVCEIYANGQIALSARLYDWKEGEWGVFVSEGQASFATELFER
ncbi:glycoside hydrolase family 32 protein [Cohnella phaseoli]|uniref:beta-fructofuranosidase n=1 Tax=Cohnella phaseoli TaxID=456490 RepID=A0A3D9KI05_9BACL|nr:glycoside hydrolase family 32 protein [Cohnella phaseoli]RED85514.1 beta-fructofuranosidase [Cohnella phaseoli]